MIRRLVNRIPLIVVVAALAFVASYIWALLAPRTLAAGVAWILILATLLYVGGVWVPVIVRAVRRRKVA